MTTPTMTTATPDPETIYDLETVYEVVCHRGSHIEPLPWRRHCQRRFRTAAEAIRALEDCLGPGTATAYAVEESQIEHGRVDVRGRHARVAAPTVRVLARRAVAYAVPMPTASLGVSIDILTFRVRDVGPEADEAGMLAGDQITCLGGLAIEDMADLRTALRRHQPGDVVPVEVERGGQRLTLALELAEGEPGGRYALDVAADIDVPRVSRFDRVIARDRIDVPTRPLR